MQLKPADFYERTRAARKIIVVDLGFLGDSIHLIPALWEIKRHYPGAQLHTLSAAVGAELLNLVPCVDSAWAFPLTQKSPAWWRHWDILRALRREKFDVAFNFSGADRTIFITALTGAKWRLAQVARYHFWNKWLIPVWVPHQSREIPTYENRRQVLEAAGFTLERAKFDLTVPEKARASVAAHLPANTIHLSVNASIPLKEWPLERWIELTKMLLENDPSLQVVATASSRPRELQRLRQLGLAVPNDRLLCLEGLNIGQLAALLQRCRLHFGADSGVLHLATALGIPSFTVFRKYPGLKEWLPEGFQNKYLAAACPCIERGRDRCTAKGGAVCLGSITATEVFEITRAMRPISLR